MHVYEKNSYYISKYFLQTKPNAPVSQTQENVVDIENIQNQSNKRKASPSRDVDGPLNSDYTEVKKMKTGPANVSFFCFVKHIILLFKLILEFFFRVKKDKIHQRRITKSSQSTTATIRLLCQESWVLRGQLALSLVCSRKRRQNPSKRVIPPTR